MPRQLRNLCFTLNNYDDAVCETLLHDERFKYICYAKEVAPTTGTPHLQGYAELEKRGLASAVARWYNWHIESRKGNQKQAIDYCKGLTEDKGNTLNPTFVERGEPAQQGSRSDLAGARALVQSGKGLRAVLMETESYQAIRGAAIMLQYFETPREWETKVMWFYGPPGSGKSRQAKELSKEKDCYWKADATKWFDGYDGHELVVFDDFRDNWFPLSDLLTILDRYECRREVKGGYRQFKPRAMIITSVFRPEELYTHARGEPTAQIMRRIHAIYRFPGMIDIGHKATDYEASSQ